MVLPFEDLQLFLQKSGKIVSRARRNSRQLKRRCDYMWEDISEDFQDLLCNISQSHEIHFYGSRIAGISNYKSDLDIYLETNGSFFFGVPEKKHREMLGKLWGALKYNSNWELITILPTATVPIIRCEYLPKRLKCKIFC